MLLDICFVHGLVSHAILSRCEQGRCRGMFSPCAACSKWSCGHGSLYSPVAQVATFAAVITDLLWGTAWIYPLVPFTPREMIEGALQRCGDKSRADKREAFHYLQSGETTALSGCWRTKLRTPLISFPKRAYSYFMSSYFEQDTENSLHGCNFSFFLIAHTVFCCNSKRARRLLCPEERLGLGNI